MVLILFLTLFLILILLRVATNLADPAVADNPNILNSLPPLVKRSLSGVNSSVTPASLVKTYLSSSYAKNVSFCPACIVLVALAVIVTSYSFLIVILDSVRSVSYTHLRAHET